MGRWLNEKSPTKGQVKIRVKGSGRECPPYTKTESGRGFRAGGSHSSLRGGAPTHRTGRDEWGTLGSEWRTLIRRVSFVCGCPIHSRPLRMSGRLITSPHQTSRLDEPWCPLATPEISPAPIQSLGIGKDKNESCSTPIAPDGPLVR